MSNDKSIPNLNPTEIKPKSKPAKVKRKPSKAEEFVNELLRHTGWCSKQHPDYGTMFGINYDNIADDLFGVPEPTLEKGGKLSEVAVLNALKKNKQFAAQMDKIYQDLAKEIIQNTEMALEDIIADREYEEERRKEREKYEKKQAAIKAEVEANQQKTRMEKVLLGETLSMQQKKLIKKLYGANIE